MFLHDLKSIGFVPEFQLPIWLDEAAQRSTRPELFGTNLIEIVGTVAHVDVTCKPNPVQTKFQPAVQSLDITLDIMLSIATRVKLAE